MDTIGTRGYELHPTGEGFSDRLKKIWKLLARYGVYGGVRVAFDLLVSKLMFPKALLIRRPFYVRVEGKLSMGPGFLSGPGLVMDVFESGQLVIGHDVKVNSHVHIAVCKRVSIGNRVLMASGVFISDHSHGSYVGEDACSPLIPPNERPLVSKDVTIEDDCWIGEKVAVLPGVSIGKGSIIGAGSVVTRSIAPYTIAAGIPAKPIKVYDFTSKQWVNCS